MGVAFDAARNIFNIMETEYKITQPTNAKKPEINGKIEFKNVTFKYPGRDNYIFKDLSFTIEPKQKVAFAGPSGTGKSTIFNLLYRFYDPESGEICLDGINIREFDI